MSSELQHKLFHFEAMPSTKVWDAITAQLDTETPDFSQRLFNYEVTAPQGAWKRIEAGLDTDATPAKLIPFYKRHNKLIRFGGMAAAILIAVVVVNLFGEKVETGTGTQTQTGSFQNPDSGKATAQKPIIASGEDLPVETNTPDNPRAIASAKTTSNRYMTMAKDDGKTVRLSKKVYPVIDCAEKTEESTWSRCKENIQALQAKMSASVGAGDFGGLIDMIKNLEENE
ncbi:MAG: hypothetical protein JWP69_1936 [Flaviaesturariibacter sp.]|nr:hypothetical protein [Flaviaesturariibacter sp.]